MIKNHHRHRDFTYNGIRNAFCIHIPMTVWGTLLYLSHEINRHQCYIQIIELMLLSKSWIQSCFNDSSFEYRIQYKQQLVCIVVNFIKTSIKYESSIKSKRSGETFI